MSLNPKNIYLKNSLLAFIPARGGSKRFPKKNIAHFFKKPLISYPIGEILKSKIFTNIIVSTDDKKIMEVSKKYGARTIKRSKKNSGDLIHELAACREYFSILQRQGCELPEYFCVIYPTAIFLKAKDIKKSFKLIDKNNKVDVVMGISKFNYHPYKAMFYNKRGYLSTVFVNKVKARSQYYENMYASNGTFYWHRTKSFLEKKYSGHYADNLIGYELESFSSMDIDYKKDLLNLKKIFRIQK